MTGSNPSKTQETLDNAGVLSSNTIKPKKNDNDINEYDIAGLKLSSNVMKRENEARTLSSIPEEHNDFQYCKEQSEIFETEKEDANKIDDINNGENNKVIPIGSILDSSPTENITEKRKSEPSYIDVRDKNQQPLITNYLKSQSKIANKKEARVVRTEEQQFNAFQYWREPVVDIDKMKIKEENRMKQNLITQYFKSVLKEDYNEEEEQEEGDHEDNLNQDNTDSSISDEIEEEANISFLSQKLFKDTKSMALNLKKKIKKKINKIQKKFKTNKAE